MVKAHFSLHAAALIDGRRARGFILMALVVFMGVMAIVAGAAIITGAQFQRRTSEEQLIFVGGEFRSAIQSYYEAGADLPAGSQRYPARLEDLLADPRSQALKRHLRQIYPDPLTGRRDWGTVQAPGGGIMGVYSPSPAKAVKLYGFPPEFKYLEGKTRISEWRFIYVAPLLPVLPPAEQGALLAPAVPAAPDLPALPGLSDLPGDAAPADPGTAPANNDSTPNRAAPID